MPLPLAVLDTLSLQALEAGSSTPHHTLVWVALGRVLLRHSASVLMGGSRD